MTNKLMKSAMAALMALSMTACSSGTADTADTKKATELELVTSLDQAILALNSNKCDAVALDGTTAQNYVDQSNGQFAVSGLYTPEESDQLNLTLHKLIFDNPEAFEAYESTFPKKEKLFCDGQLPQFCQSCGMPLTSIGDCGTNADGSTNFDYCKFCYSDGRFQQDCTMNEMIEHCLQFVDEVNKNMPKPMTKDEYKQMMQSFFPMLRRWRKMCR